MGASCFGWLPASDPRCRGTAQEPVKGRIPQTRVQGGIGCRTGRRLDILLAVVSAILGLMVGSFLNVVIYRLPRGTFLAGGKRSHCPACNAQIAWYDNLPVLSWLLLRGKARCCEARISIQYPLVELITGVAFLAIWLYQGPGGFRGSEAVWTEGGHWNLAAVLLLISSFALTASLLAASVIDLQHRILPNAINYPGLALSLLLSLLLPSIHEDDWLFAQFRETGPNTRSFIVALAGMAVGAGLLQFVAWAGKKIYGRDAMGMGDVKLMAFMGALLGPGGVLLALALSVLLGAFGGILAAVFTKDPMIPFGPSLAIGSLACWFSEGWIRYLLGEAWPLWLRTSPYGMPTLIGICVLCVFAILFLRRLRR